jgi:hypothetical protein
MEDQCAEQKKTNQECSMKKQQSETDAKHAKQKKTNQQCSIRLQQSETDEKRS